MQFQAVKGLPVVFMSLSVKFCELMATHLPEAWTPRPQHALDL